VDEQSVSADPTKTQDGVIKTVKQQQQQQQQNLQRVSSVLRKESFTR